ncbi:MAG: hypothetical protein ACJ741_02350 [Pyrinomonadaceae bacterium]
MLTRLPKLVAVLLALAVCASGSVASLAACPHAAAAATHDARARHDCCRAAQSHARPATQGEMSEHAAHETADAETSGARAAARHEDGCAAEGHRNASRVASVTGDGSTCAGCCADRTAPPRTPAATSAQKSSRSTDELAARTSLAFTSTAQLHNAFAPTQHAPPARASRLHMLISILLI